MPANPQTTARTLALLPGGLLVVLAFLSGGYDPGFSALLACGLLALVAGQLLFARDPFGGVGPLLATTGLALAALSAWTLWSGSWSQAPARALLEAMRPLAYLLVVLAFGMRARAPDAQRWTVRGIALGGAIVCGFALLSRVLPRTWPTAAGLVPERLSYPVGYWNGLGLLAAVTALLCLHLTADVRERAWVKIAAAGALPLLASALLLTYSRGALGAAALGLLAYLVLGRPRGLPAAVLAVGLPTALAVSATYGAGGISSVTPTSPVAITEGRGLALTLALAALGSATLRGLLTRWAALDRPRWQPRRRTAVVLMVALTAVTGLGIVGLSVPDRVTRQVDAFASAGEVPRTGDARVRLRAGGDNGRLEGWRSAMVGARTDLARGTGGGTFVLTWQKERRRASDITDAHGLYVETLSELGIVGALLLAVALGTLLVALALRVRGPDRALHAAAFAAVLAWCVHAGVDWDWELPAISLWVFALGAGALARVPTARRTARRATPMRLTRLGLAAGALALIAVPGTVALAQGRLDQARRAVHRDDCALARTQADAAQALLARLPGPYDVRARCAAAAGDWATAARELRGAIARDPGNWEYRYGLAIAEGVRGRDPRPALRAAHLRNPMDPRAATAVSRRLARGGPAAWRRWSRTARAAETVTEGGVAVSPEGSARARGESSGAPQVP